MKRILPSLFGTCVFTGVFAILPSMSALGQEILPGGYATTLKKPVVSAQLSPNTPQTQVVQVQHPVPTTQPIIRQVGGQELLLVEPRQFNPQNVPATVRTLQVPSQPASVPGPQVILPVQHTETPVPQIPFQMPGNVAAAPQNTANGQPAPPAMTAAPVRKIAGEAVMKNHRLQNVTAEEFEKKLTEKLGKKFVPVRNVEATLNLSRFRLPVKDGTDVELSIDRQSGMTTLVGSEAMVDSCLQIIRLMDVRENGTTTDFMPVQRANVVSVKQAANIVNEESQKTVVRTGAESEPKLAQTTPPAPAFERNGNEPTARFTAPNGAGPQPNVIPPGGIQPGAGGVPGSIVGPVQIDVIDGMDVMVIKGNPQDVLAIRAMVAQLEEMSLEHEPILELVPMQHADSYRVSQMVQQLYTQVYLSRKGSVVMLPLVKPNTIFLIGRKESIDAAKELIGKLDTEVDPATQFRIFRLRNALSDSLQTQIQTFYAARQGMGLEVQITVVSDYRTNSLIVQGSLRDLEEIRAMVEKLDTPGSDITNTVKTFSLKNAIASDLATTLQNAIAGRSTGQTGGFGNQQSGSSGTQRGDVQFTTIDAEGNLLKAHVLYDVRITADTRSNTLIVSAPAESMPLIESLIRELDQLPSAESQIKVFTLVNGDAYTLANTVLQTLFASSSTTGGGFGGGTQSSNQLATTRPGMEEGDTTLVSVRFAVDTRTNSIIACGSAGDMAVVEAILLRLDEKNMNNRKIMVMKLVNTRASDIATAINNYVTSERQLEIQNRNYYDPQSPKEQYMKEVVVVAEDISNNLIISTTPRYYNQIHKIVRELDERPLMVAIQVLIAEVRLTDNRERGIEVGLQDSLLFDRSLLGESGASIPGFLFGDPSQGLPLGNVNTGNVGTQGITSLGTGRTGSNGYGGFTFSASSESVSILVRALEERNRLRVLSRPHITALHNMKASISVGQRVPYPSGVSTDYGTTQTNVEFYEVGTILDVLPRIMPDGMISLAIMAQKSKVSDVGAVTIAVSEGQPITSPRVDQAVAETTVNAMDGQTVVFAGLITEEKTTINRSVPFLNKIPVIKHLFEFDSVSCERSELLIIMTPTIIRDEMDLERHRQQESSRMHWCINDVVKLTGNSGMRLRTDPWCTTEVQYYPGSPVVPDASQLPSDEKIQRAMPVPSLAPTKD